MSKVDIEVELVAMHQRAWNQEMERQRVAGEPASHIKATRAALKALGVPELVRAALAACTPAKEEGR